MDDDSNELKTPTGNVQGQQQQYVTPGQQKKAVQQVPTVIHHPSFGPAA